MTFEEMQSVMEKMHAEEMRLREAGAKEYAREGSNSFANFEWIAEIISRGRQEPISRETVLLVYALKHLDGVMSWVNGHRSQREDVRGRLGDLRVYFALLRGMIEEGEGEGEGTDGSIALSDVASTAVGGCCA